jgi:pilus assembly protein CpaB
MNIFRVLVLVIALIAGGVAAYLSLTVAPPPPVEVTEVVPQIDTTEVLVVSGDVGPGATLNAENVRWEEWPTTAVNPAFVDRDVQPDAIEKLDGTIVRSQFFDGEPIRDGKLVRADSGFMSAILPSGKRAMAVRVTAQSTAGGFILPNDRVDLVHTVNQVSDGQTRFVSQTLLTNIRVMAIDQTIEEQNGERVVVGKTATLELSPSEVELVTAAEKSGSLSLALRSMADIKTDDAVRKKRSSGTVRLYRSGKPVLVTTSQ